MANKNNIGFIFLILFFLFFRQRGVAQDSAYINFLIDRIAALQVKENGTFVKGLFPSYISGKEKFSTKKPDNNIFYNSLIAYTLNSMRYDLHEAGKKQIDSLSLHAKPAYEKFKNQKGRNTYNFWRTDTAIRYPYIGLVNLFRKNITLPDDLDDTVLSLLALDADDSTARAIHALMQQYVSSDSNKVRTVIKSFADYPAYSTWFGKKFPVVFDVSVLCNVLSFVQHYNLDWTKADSASLHLILETINNNYHLSVPVYASPYYPKTSLIIYHIARLMSIKPVPQLEALKPKLAEDARQRLEQTGDMLEKIILGSALLKLGQPAPAIQLPSLNELEKGIEQSDYYFFAGNVPSYFADWLRKYVSSNGWLIYYHYCPAFNDVLLLEYLLLKNKK